MNTYDTVLICFFLKHYKYCEICFKCINVLIYIAQFIINIEKNIHNFFNFCFRECEQEMWKNVTDDKGLHYIIRVSTFLK